MAQQAAGVLAERGRDGHPQAGPHVEQQALDAEGLADQVNDPVCHHGDGLVLGGVGGASTENSSPQAGDQVVRGAQRGQPLGHGLEHGVAGVVAKGVVDLFEAVQVDQHHRHPALARGLPEGLGKLLDEQCPVGQARQGVVLGLVLADGGLLAQLSRSLLLRSATPALAARASKNRRSAPLKPSCRKARSVTSR